MCTPGAMWVVGDVGGGAVGIHVHDVALYDVHVHTAY